MITILYEKEYRLNLLCIHIYIYIYDGKIWKKSAQFVLILDGRSEYDEKIVTAVDVPDHSTRAPRVLSYHLIYVPWFRIKGLE